MKCFPLFFIAFSLSAISLIGQNKTITGSVLDQNNVPLAFATVLLYDSDYEDVLKGAVTEEDGTFSISDLEEKTYRITFSFMGFSTEEKTVQLTSDTDLGTITLSEDPQSLETTVINAKLPTIQKTAGKLIFNVENTSLSTGSTFDLLKRTPGVLIIGEEIKIKFSTPTIFINGRRVYLSSAEVVTLLQNTDASAIKSVEVITNPGASYDAESGSVLNIVMSKAISVGYKGSVSGRYEQAVFPKYSATTSHSYKNKWLNFFGSYSFSPRKEFKEDENFTRFFNEDELTTKSIWESDFTRTTRSNAHQANISADITLDKKNSLNFTSSLLFSPDKTFHNTVEAEIFSNLRSLDSTFSTRSNLENNTSNVSFSLGHTLQVGEEGATVTTTANYIRYRNDQIQEVATNYFLPDGTLTRNNSFFTDALQNTNIFTGQLDLTTPFLNGSLKTGLKYSSIDTESALDFFDTDTGNSMFNMSLSDNFIYKESIYAGFAEFMKELGKFSIHLGVRGEYTDVLGDSRFLGLLNTQVYFELFPSATIDFAINDTNAISASYSRKITRPRYQSLNPFLYFINENNFNAGNPNLMPAITNRIQLSLTHKGNWFFDLYYEGVDDELASLTFQDNVNSTLRSNESNLIRGYQYSFDATYANYIKNWWYLTVTTSNYYLNNEFFALESSQETFSFDTYGFFAQMFSRLTVSKQQSISSDVSLVYISDFFTGSSRYQNQLNVSLSFRKSFWNDRASVTIGVDDIFDTNNVEVTSIYLNQDNRYFARVESRLFRAGFTYNFGNSRLQENIRTLEVDEKDRLE
ncbi:outer membrane beta-barrel protein [Jejudonia soesokkakensis]|uniref:Outer membrane beta-barrel protein n=1 Tax=Jejudonia soesokkakensis TaxID=1323432 RepID=A0ABW2MQP5_9FLAO